MSQGIRGAKGTPVGSRRRVGKAFAELHYRLRTEADTPARNAGAIWLGVAVGCLPLYGLHRLLCVVLGRLLRLNRIHAYLAAHINNPLTAAPLIYLEIATGRWILTGRWPSPSVPALRDVNIWCAGRDLVLGSIVVGVALGAILALLSYVVSRKWRGSSFARRLTEEVAKSYLQAGIFSWEWVRSKLRYDPVYFHIVSHGLLPSEGRLFELGCGRGILLSAIHVSRRLFRKDEWTADWRAPPLGLELNGVEIRERPARAARMALSGVASIEIADLRRYEVPRCRVVTLLDVLHYLDEGAQERLIEKIARALEPGGRLLIREADAAGGLRFQLTRVSERLAALARGDWRRRFHYRSVDGWTDLLARQGFRLRATPVRFGTPFTNFLIDATLSGTRTGG